VNLLQLVISRLSVDVGSAELFVTFAAKTHEDIWLGKSHPKKNREVFFYVLLAVHLDMIV